MTPVRRNIRIFKGTAFGPLIINVVDGDNVPVNLAGWIVFAHARKKPSSAIAFDLAPEITNAAAGEITIERGGGLTDDYAAGDFVWDVILENPEAVRVGPVVKGIVTVEGLATQPA